MENLFAQYGLTPWGAAPNHRHMEWYRRGKMAFIHFTVNTFTDREWGDGTESPAVFDPSELDCRQWAKVLKEGGFTTAILTAKHHDGFCLWDTAYTEHCVRNSPLKRDVVREFTDACREFGIKPGIYLSPWDRHEPCWGTEEYNGYFNGQITELLTNYGKIWEFWWDGAGSTEARYDWKQWVDTIRRLQPDCILWGALGSAEYLDCRWVGNEEGRAGDPCYATIETDIIREEICSVLNHGIRGGSRFIPAETNTSIRPGWFYHASQDHQVKTVEQLVDYWFHSAGRNTTILLNLPPDRRGLIHEIDARNVRLWKERMDGIFARNLAEGARLEASDTIHPDCGAENLLNSEDNAFYASAVRNPEVVLTFEKPVTFDCFRVEEVIELGHRVHGFALDVLQEGEWKTLLERKCIGFCYADRFAPVTADAVRLRITDADADPVLRFLGLYNGAWTEEEKEQTEGELTGLTVEPIQGGVTVDLGGIFPYDGVIWDVPEMEIYAFNGTRYEKVYAGPGGAVRFAPVTGSYKLKLLTLHKTDSLPRVFFGRMPE